MPELSDVLLDVWSQVLLHDLNIVKLGLEQFPVSASKKKRFRQVEFSFGGKMIVGIQQNPGTKSNWAKVARSGIKVMQFIQDGRYIAVVAGGKVTMYGKRTAWWLLFQVKISAGREVTVPLLNQIRLGLSRWSAEGRKNRDSRG
jgi:hypothetical protein